MRAADALKTVSSGRAFERLRELHCVLLHGRLFVLFSRSGMWDESCKLLFLSAQAGGMH